MHTHPICHKFQPVHHQTHATCSPHVRFVAESISEGEEREQLISQIQAMNAQNEQLEQRAKELADKITDLRTLLRVVGDESLQEVTFAQKINRELNNNVESLKKAMKYSYCKGGHLQECASYWGQLVN